MTAGGLMTFFMVFDDSLEYEVFNHGEGVRIVIFMSFWHPCFRAEGIPVLDRFRRAHDTSPLARVREPNQAASRKHDIAAPKVEASG